MLDGCGNTTRAVNDDACERQSTVVFTSTAGANYTILLEVSLIRVFHSKFTLRVGVSCACESA